MKVSEQIIEVINTLCQKLGVAVDWTADNILPQIEALCDKYIKFEISTSIFWIVLMVGLCILSWGLVIPLHKAAKKEDWDFDYAAPFFAVLVWVVTIGMTIAAVSVIGCQTYDIIEANVFPEKTIFDYVYGLISGTSN